MENILIIDDDKMNLKLTQFTLDKAGYNVSTALSAEEGLRMMLQSHFDLILLDIKMPGMDGIEALRVIRSTPEIADTKVLFLTASTDHSDLTEAVQLAATHFVQKPCLPEELVAAVKEACLERNDDIQLLIVDDDLLSLKVAQRAFDPIYHVKCVSSGDDALAFCRHTVPDLILMDLYMPYMDGLAAYHHIKAMKSCRHVPVVFMTVDSNPAAEQQLLQAGAVDFIRKPFIAEAVRERVKRILDLEKLQKFQRREVERRTAELHDSMEKFRRLTQQVIFALAGAIDAKDTYTNGHSSRVAEYAKEIARRAGKDENEMEDIYFAGMLHDVGKIGIPGEIITKTTKLTDEEFAIIKEHTVKGEKILSTISELPHLKVGARWHHERYDGKGYPDGLKGEEIPELARIICVADCYDAMTSNRSYRNALSQEKVRSEIEKGKGTQFDPYFADIMLQMIDDDKEFNMNDR